MREGRRELRGYLWGIIDTEQRLLFDPLLSSIDLLQEFFLMSSQSSIQCPICEGEVAARDENKAFPFCSTRCKQRDLGKWLDGNYAFAGPPASPHDIVQEVTSDSD